MRVLVTAGNTREKIDDVRDWGNIFTGNTGFSIARAIADIADVDLLTSNRQHLEDSKSISRIHASDFTSHAELKGALAALMSRQKYDAVFMAAAVADYKPTRVYAVLERQPSGERETWIVKDVQAGKVKSTHEEIAVLGQKTEKLVDLFRTEWKHTGLLVKFKLEVDVSKDELIRIGQVSRKSSGADYLVANTLDMVSGDKAGAFLLSDAGEEWVPRNDLSPRLKGLLLPNGK
ncbi:MAG: bifunctional phosphopantothenoylcysteine decarboxylase/phosphopantothenate synthase [Anaerolineae bacterium]|nr:bifunctional phosphopantothenoylcysteine decarboxylase/phosphopantothenate synthase [Phycisphaerae bacterium]